MNKTIYSVGYYRIVFLAFFFLPIENLVFAPSAGWPAISPVFFFIAFLISFRVFNFGRIEVLVFSSFSALSVLGWSSTHIFEGGSRNFISDVSGSFFPLILGYSFFKVFLNLIDDDDFFKKAIEYYLKGAFLSVFLSVFFWVFYKYLGMGFISDIAQLLFKRNGELERFSFLFAEPSFVSVHLFGVLLPFIFYCWKLGWSEHFNMLLRVFFLYLLFSFLFMDSVRFYIDVIFFAGVFLYFKMTGLFLRPSNIKVLFFVIFSIFSFSLLYKFPILIEWLTLGRVKAEGGMLDMLGSDPSLASRFFRMDALINGFDVQPIHLITGVGFGNVGYLVDLGFVDALKNFGSNYFKEVEDIARDGNGPNVFNMYTRLVGEFGLLVTAIMLVAFYEKRIAFLYLVVGWCYIQFDSYAFYGGWIYLAIFIHVRRTRNYLNLTQEKKIC
jgi:hypothetical protein